jgi:hypothetical protein
MFASGSGDMRARVWRVSADRNEVGATVPAGPPSKQSPVGVISVAKPAP